MGAVRTNTKKLKTLIFVRLLCKKKTIDKMTYLFSHALCADFAWFYSKTSIDKNPCFLVHSFLLRGFHLPPTTTRLQSCADNLPEEEELYYLEKSLQKTINNPSRCSRSGHARRGLRTDKEREKNKNKLSNFV